MQKRFAFTAGDIGTWKILSASTVRGSGLPAADRLNIQPAGPVVTATGQAVWTLSGMISNLRYATRSEVTQLRGLQQGLGRSSARRAALIPIRKSAAWWELAQDERRAIFEEQSRHTAIGLGYLPGVARQLYHCRDLDEPFDFLTWFEFDAAHCDAFEDLVLRLRATPEWNYVEREVDIRLEKD